MSRLSWRGWLRVWWRVYGPAAPRIAVPFRSADMDMDLAQAIDGLRHTIEALPRADRACLQRGELPPSWRPPGSRAISFTDEGD